ncbi:hypothetical protein BRY73_08310 [Ochrobactrum sp. P6BS-III]|nr:hypothetical protein BRY73_08310 [Ochrobactrum sp. P6BS-III]
MIGETDKVTLRFTHHYWRFTKLLPGAKPDCLNEAARSAPSHDGEKILVNTHASTPATMRGDMV